MPRPVICVILLAALAPGPSLTAVADPDASPLLGEGVCEAPFNLVVPAGLVRERSRLVVVAHDDGSGGRLLFDLGVDALTVALQRDGQTTELCRVEAVVPREGGEIVLKRRPGGVAVAYGATTVLRADADLPDGGRWGVLDAPADILDGIAFQPTGEIVFGDDFMRAAGDPATWEQVSGGWGVSQLRSARYSANAFTFVGSATGRGPALAATGYWFWEDMTVEAAVRPSEGAGGFGVGLAFVPDGDYRLLRFMPGDGAAGLLQLVRVRGGDELVLDETPAVAHPDEWHRLAISGVAGHLAGALDGVELVAADDPGLAHGRAMLWAVGEEPVAFDDVEAYSGPRRQARPVVLSHQAQSSDPVAAAFINDQYMREWADERDQWLSGSGGVWHAGYFWGDIELAWELTERALRQPVELHVCVPVAGERFSPPSGTEAGCHLSLARADDGKLAVVLRDGAKVSAQLDLAMPDLPAVVSLRRTGDLVEALVAGEVVASFTAEAPAAGKVGLSAPTARYEASRLRIVSSNMIDSAFRAAPTDWHIGSGEWGVSSRWSCTPRWSWFQGHSRELAAIWTRRSFPSDTVVEFFAGISMYQPWAPFYQHLGNLCVTLCGSDATPGSGYSLVFAGWGNSSAGIFRRGELVARVPGFTMPDIVDSLGGTAGRDGAHKLHNEWWQIRAERAGATVRLLVDGRLAASFEDPDPLPGGAVGIWTLDNAMTVARARIYYQDDTNAPPAVPTPARVGGAPSLPLPELEPSHVAAAFEDGVGAWGPAAPGACEVALAERDSRRGGRCLRVTNPTAGGTFALAAPVAGLDLRDHPVLAFDCAIPEGVMVDGFAVVGGRRYRLGLTGPEAPVPGIEELARTEARADGRWRSISVDLLGLMRPFFEPGAPIVLDGLQFAAHAVPEYVRAGIGGNAAGASWRLDSFFLGAPVSGSVTLRTPRDVEVTAPGCTVQRDVERGGATRRVTPRHSGPAAITVTSGPRSASDLVAFDLDPPAVEPVAPVPDAAWLGPAVAVRVDDAGLAGIDEQSLMLEVAGKRFGWPHPALRWNPAAGELSLDLREAGVELKPDGPVQVHVGPVADRAGNQAEALVYAFTPDPSADESPPDPPQLSGLPQPLVDCDFEADAGPLRLWGVDAAVELRRVRGPAGGNPSGGDWCLQARCTELGGLFGVSLGCTPFEASRYPILQFDYRAPEELRVDLIVEVDGTRRVIKFADNDATWRSIGSIGAIADDRWHSATVDLHGLLQRAFGGRASLPVTDLFFASSGWPGNRRDTHWWLDNVRVSAALNAAPRANPAPALTSRDESGLSAFGWAVDGSPDTQPPADPAAADLPGALAGHAGELVWVHAAARDAAGNWSAASHLPVRVAASDDAVAPVASEPAPGPDQAACSRTVTVTLSDEGSGVSPADLLMTVNGEAYTIAGAELVFDESSGLVTWSLPAGVSLGDDGARVACRVEGRDLAGNAMEALSWVWRVDHTLDGEPPGAPVASYLPASVADANGFEEDTGGWGNFIDGQVLRRATGGATGPGCTELRHLASRRGSGFVLVRDFGDDWRSFPMVRFRYRLDGTRSGRLEVYGTTFDGSRDRWTELGSLSASGDGWRTARLDLAQALARTSPSLDIHRLFLSIEIRSPDGAIIVDDYAMYSQAATSAAFEWSEPADPSGIRGYSWLLDSADETMPPEAIIGEVRRAEFSDLSPGHYCFHVRACDGAGNWGPPSHVPFDLVAPE